MKISTILDKVDEYQLFVPAFQREYVWKRDDAKQLIDSLIKEYPTGTMLTWETRSPPALKGPHEYDEKQGAVRILLDGQQRITTLYMLVRGEIPPYYTKPEITYDTRNLYVNVETLELAYYTKMRMEHDPRWRNITDIFQRLVRAKDVVRELEEKGDAVDRSRDDLIDDNMRAIENILDREFPEQTIPINASVRDAIDIFYKVNASGVALTDAELALAQISGYWPEARDLFKHKLAELQEQGFNFRLDFVVYVLLGCLHYSGSDMRKLHDAENNTTIRAAWQRLEEQVLDYVVNIMRTYAYVDHTHEINSIYALVPIIVYCFQRQDAHLSESQIKKMVKWFYYSQIRARYVSQLPQKLDRDLRLVRDSGQPFDELLNIIEEERRLEILPEEFSGRVVQHPFFSLMRWYFKSRGAICLTTGMSLRRNMGKNYRLESDHIFPFSRLKKVGYGRDNRVKYQLAQEITNRAILTQVANRTKSATTAADYLAEARDRFPRALEMQCIPTDESLWTLENYERFLHARRRILANELNEFLEGLTRTAEAASPVDIEELIAEGESDSLEFKSSLRWDYQQGTANKRLEDTVLKTLAAFANGAGGTLLIGVDDDGNVLGLENDYASLSGERDKFELHLRNLLNQHFGEAFTASKLVVSFPNVGDEELCLIEVTPADEPVVVRFKGTDGQAPERFFVRSGNSSRELPLSEMQSYFRSRFA